MTRTMGFAALFSQKNSRHLFNLLKLSERKFLSDTMSLPHRPSLVYFHIDRSCLLTASDRKDRESEKEKLFSILRTSERKPVALLSGTVTPEVEAEILAENKNKSFLLRQALVEIKGVERRKKLLFTLPKSLSIEEWRTLISLNDYRSRLRYLQALELEEVNIEEIRARDNVYCNPLDISEEMINDAVGDDQEARRRIKIFLMHHEIRRQDGEMVPFVIKTEDVAQIAQITSTNGHRKFISFLFKNELLNFHNELRKKDKGSRKEELAKAAIERKLDTEHLVYGLGFNTIFLRLQRNVTNNFYNWNALGEFRDWGIPLIIDMSYYNNYRLPPSRQRSLFTEIINAISLNKMAKTPFQLHFTSMSENSLKGMEKFYPSGLQQESPCNVTEQSHLDMFSPERLVYLSPDSDNDLKKFDPNDIYVIGGIVDKTDEKQPLTLSAAKRLKVRHARLPMRRYLGLTAELNIDTCVSILNDLKESQDWFYAFRWVPARHFASRLRSSPTENLEHQLRYRAHRHLSPTVWKGEDYCTRNQALNATKYRMFYKRVMDSRTREEMEDILEELKI